MRREQTGSWCYRLSGGDSKRASEISEEEGFEAGWITVPSTGRAAEVGVMVEVFGELTRVVPVL